jgi:hypothetical protein
MNRTKIDRQFEIIDSLECMIPNIAVFIEDYPLYGRDKDSFDQWSSDIRIYFKEAIEPFVDNFGLQEKILEWFLMNIETFHSLEMESLSHSQVSFSDREKKLESLLNRPQFQQRTEEWYSEGNQILTASQFSTLFKGPRTRGLLVLEKAGLIDKSQRTNRICCKLFETSPFDWGIRFEPVVRQIYCDITKTDVSELGRLRHQTDKRLAASPDGLITHDLSGSTVSRLGRFVEFKAPVTRLLNKKVPEDYYAQMQIQMEVGDVDTCDYFEVKFKSPYGKNQENFKIVEPTDKLYYYGSVYLIGKDDVALRYEYSPLQTKNWIPVLNEGETILETIPWITDEWWLTTVDRSESWYTSVKPFITEFWSDVEKAKEGTFKLPDSKRKRKESSCDIVDIDELTVETIVEPTNQ